MIRLTKYFNWGGFKMKQLLRIILPAMLTAVLTGCGTAPTNAPAATTSVPQTESAQATVTEPTQTPEETQTVPEVVVTVTNKENVPKDINNGIFSDRVQLVFDVQNNTDKDVKGVQGTLVINDLFGKHILSMNCDFTGQIIPANSKVTFSELGMDINEFMDDHLKLYNENFEDLNFVYNVSETIYQDQSGSADASSAPEEAAGPISVKVTSKESVPKDINKSRFSARVQFVFDVQNHTDKDVKGVQGALVIQDLFGKDILTMSCDFTGQTIPANSTAAFSELGMDINEFMDDHLKLYNEKFEDLNFVYNVSAIVYADGTTENP